MQLLLVRASIRLRTCPVQWRHNKMRGISQAPAHTVSPAHQNAASPKPPSTDTWAAAVRERRRSRASATN